MRDTSSSEFRLFLTFSTSGALRAITVGVMKARSRSNPDSLKRLLLWMNFQVVSALEADGGWSLLIGKRSRRNRERGEKRERGTAFEADGEGEWIWITDGETWKVGEGEHMKKQKQAQHRNEGVYCLCASLHACVGLGQDRGGKILHLLFSKNSTKASKKVMALKPVIACMNVKILMVITGKEP